jgi:hypothetical protein
MRRKHFRLGSNLATFALLLDEFDERDRATCTSVVAIFDDEETARQEVEKLVCAARRNGCVIQGCTTIVSTRAQGWSMEQ